MNVKINRKFNRTNFKIDTVYIYENENKLTPINEVVFFTRKNIINEIKDFISQDMLYDIMYNKEPIEITLEYTDYTFTFLLINNTLQLKQIK